MRQGSLIPKKMTQVLSAMVKKSKTKTKIKS